MSTAGWYCLGVAGFRFCAIDANAIVIWTKNNKLIFFINRIFIQ
jgi:hypothetical protein